MEFTHTLMMSGEIGLSYKLLVAPFHLTRVRVDPLRVMRRHVRAVVVASLEELATDLALVVGLGLGGQLPPSTTPGRRARDRELDVVHRSASTHVARWSRAAFIWISKTLVSVSTRAVVRLRIGDHLVQGLITRHRGRGKEGLDHLGLYRLRQSHLSAEISLVHQPFGVPARHRLSPEALIGLRRR